VLFPGRLRAKWSFTVASISSSYITRIAEMGCVTKLPHIPRKRRSSEPAASRPPRRSSETLSPDNSAGRFTGWPELPAAAARVAARHYLRHRR
jgi:hypothetical protein